MATRTNTLVVSWSQERTRSGGAGDGVATREVTERSLGTSPRFFRCEGKGAGGEGGSVAGGSAPRASDLSALDARIADKRSRRRGGTRAEGRWRRGGCGGGHRQPKTTSVSAAGIFTIKKCERWKRTFREYPDGYESTTRSARAPRRRVDLSLPHGRARTRSVGACGIRDARVSPNAMPVDSSESVGDASRKQKIQTTARSGIAPQSGWREACDHARRAGDDLEGLSDRLFASPGARSNDPARARVPRATPNAGHRPHLRLLLFLALALTTRIPFPPTATFPHPSPLPRRRLPRVPRDPRKRPSRLQQGELLRRERQTRRRR